MKPVYIAALLCVIVGTSVADYLGREDMVKAIA